MGTHFKSLIVSWICVLCFNTSNVIFGGRLDLLLRYLFALKVIFYTSRKIQLYSCWNLCLCWNVRATIINTSFIYDCFKQFLVFCQYKEYYIWFNFKVHVFILLSFQPWHVLFVNFLQEMAKILSHPKVYSFLHVPVQSASDSVLMDMKREYCIADFKHVVDFLRER